MENIPFILLQASPNPLVQWGPLLLILAVFYFFIIRPQSQKQKKQNKFIQALEKGDDVVTTSGILGKITKIDDNIITLEVGQKSYIRITRGAISRELTEEVHKS